MAVVSISLPDSLLTSADRVIERRGFSGRSEFLRACVREFLAANVARERPGRRTATLVLVYREGKEKPVSRIRHEFGDVIRTAVHSHSHEACVEVFLLEAKGERIQAFADALRTVRDALQVSLTFTDAWMEEASPHPAGP